MTFSVKCPTCGKDLVYDVKNKYRPFCSERCRMVDLGQWFEESYSISGEEADSIEKPENYE